VSATGRDLEVELGHGLLWGLRRRGAAAAAWRCWAAVGAAALRHGAGATAEGAVAARKGAGAAADMTAEAAAAREHTTVVARWLGENGRPEILASTAAADEKVKVRSNRTVKNGEIRFSRDDRTRWSNDRTWWRQCPVTFQ
jgi:hypothetical protein